MNVFKKTKCSLLEELEYFPQIIDKSCALYEIKSLYHISTTYCTRFKLIDLFTLLWVSLLTYVILRLMGDSFYEGCGSKKSTKYCVYNRQLKLI